MPTDIPVEVKASWSLLLYYAHSDYRNKSNNTCT